MKKQVEFEKKWFKIQEQVAYILVPVIAYFHMRSSEEINPLGYIGMLVGFSLFFIAKLSLIRKGIYFSIGCDNMTQKMSLFYGFGYLIFIGSFVYTFPINNPFLIGE